MKQNLIVFTLIFCLSACIEGDSSDHAPTPNVNIDNNAVTITEITPIPTSIEELNNNYDPLPFSNHFYISKAEPKTFLMNVKFLPVETNICQQAVPNHCEMANTAVIPCSFLSSPIDDDFLSVSINEPEEGQVSPCDDYIVHFGDDVGYSIFGFTFSAQSDIKIFEEHFGFIVTLDGFVDPIDNTLFIGNLDTLVDVYKVVSDKYAE